MAGRCRADLTSTAGGTSKVRPTYTTTHRWQVIFISTKASLYSLTCSVRTRGHTRALFLSRRDELGVRLRTAAVAGHLHRRVGVLRLGPPGGLQPLPAAPRPTVRYAQGRRLNHALALSRVHCHMFD